MNCVPQFSDISQKNIVDAILWDVCHPNLKKGLQSTNDMCPPLPCSLLLVNVLFGTLHSFLKSCLASEIYKFGVFLRKILLRVWEVIMTHSQKPEDKPSVIIEICA